MCQITGINIYGHLPQLIIMAVNPDNEIFVGIYLKSWAVVLSLINHPGLFHQFNISTGSDDIRLIITP